MSSNRLSSGDPAREVQARLRALSTEIDRLDGLAASRFGLNRTDMRALDLIRTAGTLTPTALADQLGFTTGGVTTVIDRLEGAGYVRRRPDGTDRRRVVLEATASVAAKEAEVFGDLIAATISLTSRYSDRQLATIADFLDKSRGVVADHVDRLMGTEER
jgi:DNA-binding MarR family transcriptional regulator